MSWRSSVAKFVVAGLALLGPSLWAQDGLAGALARSSVPSAGNLTSPLAQRIAVADFDGDNRPDGAVLIDHGWLQPKGTSRKIELHFSGRSNTELTFESSEASLTVSALDVNRDGATDIVVEQPFTHKRLLVWLNDGRGSFHQVRSDDFPAADTEVHETLQPPGHFPDCPALCLTLRLGVETAMLAPCGVVRAVIVATGFASDQSDISRNSAVFSPRSPRAPPSVLL